MQASEIARKLSKAQRATLDGFASGVLTSCDAGYKPFLALRANGLLHCGRERFGTVACEPTDLGRAVAAAIRAERGEGER